MTLASIRLALMGAVVVSLAVRPIPAASQRGARNSADADSIKARYRKLEVRIPMRDGVKLFTSVYLPRDSSRAHPILMDRTPYGVAPYGADAYRTSLGPSGNPQFTNANFIFVYQDARGRYESEGAYTEMTPHKDVKRGTHDVDESTDSYDTVDWLIKNLPHNNGKVGYLRHVVPRLLYDGQLHRSASGAQGMRARRADDGSLDGRRPVSQRRVHARRELRFLSGIWTHAAQPGARTGSTISAPR